MSKLLDKLRDKVERNKEIKFLEFMQDRVDEFNRAEISANKIKDYLNTGNNIQSIFGLQSEILDKLIIEIQSSEEWKNINTKSKKLPILNSNLKNNRKKLRKWLLEQSPTKNLSKYLENEYKMKANITQILEIVKNGRALIQPVFNDPHSKYIYNSTFYRVILEQPQCDNDPHYDPQAILLEQHHCDNDPPVKLLKLPCTDILFEQIQSDDDPRAIIKLKGIKEELDKNILDLEHSMHEIAIFIKDWQEQSKKDNVMLVNLNELIEWYKESDSMSVSVSESVSVSV